MSSRRSRTLYQWTLGRQSPVHSAGYQSFVCLGNCNHLRWSSAGQRYHCPSRESSSRLIQLHWKRECATESFGRRLSSTICRRLGCTGRGHLRVEYRGLRRSESVNWASCCWLGTQRVRGGRWRNLSTLAWMVCRSHRSQCSTARSISREYPRWESIVPQVWLGKTSFSCMWVWLGWRTSQISGRKIEISLSTCLHSSKVYQYRFN